MLYTVVFSILFAAFSPAQQVTKHSVREVPLDQLNTLADPFFVQTWADFIGAGGKGRVFLLELDLTAPERLTFQIMNGPIIYVTQKPSLIYLQGNSVYNHSAALLDAIKNYDQSPIFILPYGRGVHGAVFERQFDFLVELYELALPQQITNYAFVLTPSLGPSTFVHEMEHVRQKEPNSPHAQFVKELNALNVDPRLIGMTARFGAELKAYEVQWNDLESKEHSTALPLDYVVNTQLTHYRISKLEPMDGLALKRDDILHSVDLHASALRRLHQNLDKLGRAQEICPARAVVMKHLKSDLFPLEVLIPEWVNLKCS